MPDAGTGGGIPGAADAAGDGPGWRSGGGGGGVELFLPSGKAGGGGVRELRAIPVRVVRRGPERAAHLPGVPANGQAEGEAEATGEPADAVRLDGNDPGDDADAA